MIVMMTVHFVLRKLFQYFLQTNRFETWFVAWEHYFTQRGCLL